MKIRYNGSSAVLAPSTDDEVQPGDVIDIADDIAATLLIAGYSFDNNGAQVAVPDNPIWSLPATVKAPKGANVPAEPVKEG